MTDKHNDAVSLLTDVVKRGVNLPGYIFYERFTKYFFFDNDICTSEYLIDATKTIVGKCFGDDSVASVFSSSDFEYLGDIHIQDDWIEKIRSLSSKMNDAGDYGGLIIFEQKKRWALFQKTPVDEGVLGLSSNESLEPIADLIYENFVDCEVFRVWLEQKTQRDINLVQTIGREYLIRVMNNYSANPNSV